MAKVVVVGLGYIGLPTAAMLALHGHQVLGVDIQTQIVDSLRAGNVPVREKDLTAIVRDALRTDRLRVAMKPEIADFFVICVPTPKGKTGADLTAVKAASRSIAQWVQRGSTVIIESTVPPLTSEKIVKPILEKRGLKAGRDFHLAYCPERVMPGNIVREIVENDRVIGGFTRASAEKARRLYSSFVRGQTYLTDLATAEFVKLSENAFRDVNIAFSNELADLAEAHGVNIWDVIELANRHPRVRLLRPGPGVGGHCIAVDPVFLLTPSVNARIIKAARTTNDRRPGKVIQRAVTFLRGVSRPKIAALGVAYKGNADDIRESPAIKVIEGLRRRGLRVVCYDPIVPHEAYPTMSLEEALDAADLILILADHRDFYYIDPLHVSNRVRRRILFDTRNCIDHRRWAKCGFVVYVIGSRNPIIASLRPRSPTDRGLVVGTLGSRST